MKKLSILTILLGAVATVILASLVSQSSVEATGGRSQHTESSSTASMDISTATSAEKSDPFQNSRTTGGNSRPPSEDAVTVENGWALFQIARSANDAATITKGLLAFDECKAHIAKDQTSIESSVLQLLTLNSKDRDARIAASKNIVKRCDGFNAQRVEDNEIEGLWQKAEQLGSKTAIARSVNYTLTGSKLPANEIEAKLCYALLGGKFEPNAVEQVTVRVAAIQRKSIYGFPSASIPPVAISAALDIAACNLGKDCGPKSMSVLGACAYGGLCDDIDHTKVIKRTSPQSILPMIDILAQRFTESIKNQSCDGIFGG